MAKSLADWLQEGDEVYQATVEEYRQLEEQLRELATRWRTKKAEIDKLAGILGKPPLPEEHGAEHGAEEHTAERPRIMPRANLNGPAVRR